MKIISQTNQQTINIGKKIASQLKGGEVLALSGDLGAGKTTLTKGLALGLGIKKVVISPTFLLLRLYKINNKKTKIKYLVHIDCYRLKSADELIDIGADEYFNRPDTVVVIEWPERVKKILPKKTIKISLKVKNNQSRSVEISHF
ncbi:MAG: tRNA (adenosine(37)-N6)-threonylcarbamoyltransferase complex ATPase subunit type 1 TsaE [Candidatus Buchananbacteria bacterium]|nr:tRNA (adenosine(37)-N6)-threonylcarbamoyltransferase complex ATPase subunit type 1 TsaE [Candidatus Buchananbacteria bacterium]